MSTRQTRWRDRANRGYTSIPTTSCKAGVCNACGRPLDCWHNLLKCAEEFLKAEDAKGNPSCTRRKP